MWFCGGGEGADKLRLQYLKDLLQHMPNEDTALLSALADFCNLVLHGYPGGDATFSLVLHL